MSEQHDKLDADLDELLSGVPVDIYASTWGHEACDVMKRCARELRAARAELEIARMVRQKLNSLNGALATRCVVLASEVATIDAEAVRRNDERRRRLDEETDK